MQQKRMRKRAEFPKDTISVLGIGKDGGLVYYFRGTVYADVSGKFAGNPRNARHMPEVREAFNRSFVECGEMSFDLFLEKYWEVINGCERIFGSYLSEDDYFRLMCSVAGTDKEDGVRIKRPRRENHWVSMYISMLLEMDSPHPSDEEARCTVSYKGADVSFEYGDGVCEILDDFAGYIYEDDFWKCSRYVVTSAETVMLAMLEAMMQQHVLLQGLRMDFLLLEAYPFDISFGPKWGNIVPKIIAAYTTFPTRGVETFDFVGTDKVAIKIGVDRIHEIDVEADFGYMPKDLECTVSIDANSRIDFTLKDMSRGKERTYELDDLFRRHRKDWVRNHG